MFIVSIEPGQGLRGLRFGSTRHQTRAFFGPGYVKITDSLTAEADQWPGVTAHFKDDQTLIALALRGPMRFDIDGQAVSGMKFQSAVELIRKLDADTLVAPDAAHSSPLCLTILAPPDPEGFIS